MTYGLSESEFLSATQVFEVNGEFVGRQGPILGAISEFVQMLGGATILSLFFIFPNGKFVPHWSYHMVALWGGLNVVWTLFPRVPLNANYYDTWIKTPELSFGIYFLFFTVGLGAQIYRYRRVATPNERQQAKWVLVGLMFAYTAQWVQFFPLMPADPHHIEGAYIMPLVVALKGMLPITVTLSIMRYRLWDIDIFINRALVYSILTVLIGGIYIGLAVIFSRILELNVLHYENSLVASLGATVIVVILFQPMRERVQYAVNRLMYGERDDPYTVINRLTDQYGHIERVSDILLIAVQTIAQALKLPYAAVELKQIEGLTDTIEYHARHNNSLIPIVLERYDLIFQNAIVGELAVARRHPKENLTARDIEFLNRLKPLIAVVAHDVQLANRVKRLLDRSVRASAEERRLLSRALHSGIGSSMAAQLMNLDIALNQLEANPEAALAKLNLILKRWQELYQAIRELAHNLRPDLSPEVAFRENLRYEVEKMQTGVTEIYLDLPDDLPDMPAAVETALLGILQNALANMLKHANAAHCWVRVWVEANSVWLTIRDDGQGFDVTNMAGHGLREMREWAEELNGTLVIHSSIGLGTTVEAQLPLVQP